VIDQAIGFVADDEVVVVPCEFMVGVGRPCLVFVTPDRCVDEASTAGGEGDLYLVDDSVGEMHGRGDGGAGGRCGWDCEGVTVKHVRIPLRNQ